ncbi:iron-containing redox enzyme family protein [Yinghuangia aomiensis]|uniref:Iron-containing redox enzyme family protein n=1 Tax=Yinghuangia aomiensis TaxID=676205 RepID=A0ABP9IA12_9ACTN
MKLPAPRGPISTELFEGMRHAPGPFPPGVGKLVAARARSDEDARTCEDVQISLFVCYGMHYGTFDDVDERWEWQPSLLEIRAGLEEVFERDFTKDLQITAPVPAADIPTYLMELTSPAHTSTLPRFIHHTATLEQFRELVIHRSIDNLHEGDAHTWAIPRVSGRAKSALVEIQADEYGGGMPGRMHAELYAYLMEELDLEPGYGAYIEQIPAIALAIHNLKSFFGLHRRWRGALLGNLAVTEIGSSITNRKYSEALARVGASDRARWFYDEHITADAVHEQLAAHDMCGAFAHDHPEETVRVMIGAAATLDIRGMFANTATHAWADNVSSLRVPTPV